MPFVSINCYDVYNKFSVKLLVYEQGITKQLMTEVSGHVLLDIHANCNPRPSASGNILASGPTDHLLPSTAEQISLYYYIFYNTK